jgi:mannose-6-phosphate isomerase-like protein (cupin superfamily)
MPRNRDASSLRNNQTKEATAMPKVSRDSATQGGDFGPVVDRHDQLEGYSVNFTTFNEDIDATPLMKGLPDDRCQRPHWGYVINGKATFRYADREEVFEAGDAFYTPPGHVPVKHEPGTEFVMFSPADELRKTEAVMMKNMQVMQAG